MERTTIDHDVIRKWIEKHHGKPAIIPAGAGSSKVGLRINFLGMKDELFLSHSRPSVETDWDTFFRYFEEQKLAFTYKKDLAPDDDPTLGYYFVSREVLEE